MTTVIDGSAAKDGFSVIITLLDSLAKPEQVKKAIANLREATAEQVKAAASAKALIDQAEQARLELSEREQKLLFREETVKAAESDVIDQTEKAQQRTRDVEVLEREFQKELEVRTESLNARDKALAAREEQLQSDTTRISEQHASRERKIGENEAAAQAALADAERLQKEWNDRINALRNQVQAAMEVTT